MSALNIAEIIIPDKTNESGVISFLSRARLYVRQTLIIRKTSANAVACILIPDIRIPREAPNAAPELTPKISGLTSGFLKIPWKTVPVIANPSPTSIFSKMRGMRRFQTTEASIFIAAASFSFNII